LDRPIFELERTGAEAWGTGGAEAERKAREEFQKQKREEERKQLQDFRDWQKTRRAERLAGINVPQQLTAEEQARIEEERAHAARVDAEAERKAVAEGGVSRLAKQCWQNPDKDLDDFVYAPPTFEVLPPSPPHDVQDSSTDSPYPNAATPTEDCCTELPSLCVSSLNSPSRRFSVSSGFDLENSDSESEISADESFYQVRKLSLCEQLTYCGENGIPASSQSPLSLGTPARLYCSEYWTAELDELLLQTVDDRTRRYDQACEILRQHEKTPVELQETLTVKECQLRYCLLKSTNKLCTPYLGRRTSSKISPSSNLFQEVRELAASKTSVDNFGNEPNSVNIHTDVENNLISETLPAGCQINQDGSEQKENAGLLPTVEVELEWSEDMDSALLNSVEAFDFDFEAVTDFLLGKPEIFAGMKPLLTVERCRQRFAEIDGQVMEDEITDNKENPEQCGNSSCLEGNIPADEGFEDEDSKEAQYTEQEMEMIRQERVQESLAIYRRQQAEKKQLKEMLLKANTENSFLQGYHHGYIKPTFPADDEVCETKDSFTRISRTKVYWTEQMDMALAHLVVKTDFDFRETAASILNDASIELDDKAKGLIDEEECRLRWAFLDLESWSQSGVAEFPESSQNQPYSHGITPERLEELKNMAKYSFEELQQQSDGQYSKYLKFPENLPSMHTNALDEDDGKEETFLSREELERCVKGKQDQEQENAGTVTLSENCVDFDQLD